MKSIVYTLAILSASVSSAAVAQASSDGQSDSDGQADQPVASEGARPAGIVVTAQRRSESLQDVPISMVAITSEMLQSAGIETTQDLQLLTPGLVMPNVRNTTTPYLRGIGTQSGTAGTEGAVAVYIDGVYLPSAVSTVFSLNNIERIEVLKGPQGTLFGRNATGGLIHVITREPSEVPELNLSLGYANYDTATGSLYATAGLTNGVSADIALYGTYQGDGWGHNFLGQEVGFRREAMARTRFRFELGEATTAIVTGDYARNRNDVGNVRTITEGSVAQGGFVRTGGDYDSLTGQPVIGRDSENYGASLFLRHELSDRIELTSTTAYRHLKVFSLTDTDSTPPVNADFVFEEVGRTFQQELLLNADFDSLNLTGGLFYFHNNAGWNPLEVFVRNGSPANADRFSRVRTDSYAAFLQGTYEVAPETNFTVGLRYNVDDTSVDGRFVAHAGNPNPPGTVTFDTDNLPFDQTHRSFDALSWRVALDHRISDNALVYASYNRGFKSGTFNATAPAAPALNPEELDAYEIGVKTDLFDRTVRFNVAGFYYDYRNIQLQIVTGTGTQTLNAPSGRIKGVEVEVVWSPRLDTGNLQISTSASFLDANYGTFSNAPISTPNDPNVTPFGGNTVTRGDATGNRMIKAPEFTLNATVDYSVPVSNRLMAGSNITWQHNSGFFWEVDNRLAQSAYDVVNAQIYFGDRDDAWRVRLWARNLFDERYVIYGSSSRFTDASVFAPPRSFGVTLEMNFGG